MTTKFEEIGIPESIHSLLVSSPFGLMSTIRHSDGLLSTNPVGFVWDGRAFQGGFGWLCDCSFACKGL